MHLNNGDIVVQHAWRKPILIRAVGSAGVYEAENLQQPQCRAPQLSKAEPLMKMIILGGPFSNIILIVTCGSSGGSRENWCSWTAR